MKSCSLKSLAKPTIFIIFVFIFSRIIANSFLNFSLTLQSQCVGKVNPIKIFGTGIVRVVFLLLTLDLQPLHQDTTGFCPIFFAFIPAARLSTILPFPILFRITLGFAAQGLYLLASLLEKARPIESLWEVETRFVHAFECQSRHMEF